MIQVRMDSDDERNKARTELILKYMKIGKGITVFTIILTAALGIGIITSLIELLLTGSTDIDYNNIYMSVFLLAIIWFFFGKSRVTKKRVRKEVEKGNEKFGNWVIYTIDSESVEIARKTYRLTEKWSVYDSYGEHGKYFYMHSTVGSLVIIDKGALTAGEYELLKRYCSEKIVKKA